MKKYILSALFLFSLSSIGYAQNVGVNTATPDASSLLDLTSTNRGLLVPRISIGNVTLPAPVAAPATSLLVYNTNAATTGGSGAGFYYWDGTKWASLGKASVDNGLYYNGTSGTIRLGGPLVEATTVTQGVHQMNFNLNSTGDFNVQDAGVTHFQVRDDGRTFFGDDTYWKEGSVTGTTIAQLYNLGDDGIFQVWRNGAIQHNIHSIGTTVFNEQGGSYDFRIESNTNTNMVFVDASADCIGFQNTPNTTTIGGSMVNEMYHPFEVGNDGGGGLQATISWFNGSDVMILPETDWYGYVGRSINAWWRMYSYGFVVASSKHKKRNIIPINSNKAIEDYVMAEIDKFEPHFYKYQHELDEASTDADWTKYRQTMHIGALVEESPDFLQDEAFSGIEVYGMASLSLAGVKANRAAIKELKTRNVSDFGSTTLSSTELFIPYSSEFVAQTEGNLPVVTVTTNDLNVSVSITEKTAEGFKVSVSSLSPGLTIDWIAMAKVQIKDEGNPSDKLDPELLQQLEVSEEFKAERRKLYGRTPTISPQGLK